MNELTLSEVLRGGRQCDMDGCEIIMSRQACCVAADQIESDAKRIAELEALLLECRSALDGTKMSKRFRSDERLLKAIDDAMKG